jgi:hypothetical protein
VLRCESRGQFGLLMPDGEIEREESVVTEQSRILRMGALLECT